MTIFYQTLTGLLKTIPFSSLLQTAYFLQSADFPDDQDFAPGLFFGVLLVFFVILFCIGAGIVFAVLSVLAIVAFTTLGIISTSVYVGLYKKSFSKGALAFFLLVGALAGVFTGVGGFLFITILFDLSYTLPVILVSGSIGGLIAGILFGFLFFKILKLTAKLVQNKLKLENTFS